MNNDRHREYEDVAHHHLTLQRARARNPERCSVDQRDRRPEQPGCAESSKSYPSVFFPGQLILLEYLANGGLEPLVNLLKNDQDKEVKAKALYAISGLLKHCPSAVEAFELQGGFKLLGDLLKETDSKF